MADMNTDPKPRMCVSIVITVEPSPLLGREEFTLSVRSATSNSPTGVPPVVGVPTVISKYPLNKDQSLTVKVQAIPPPPADSQLPPPLGHGPYLARDGWPDDHAAFGEMLRRTRARLGISQPKLAKRVGITELTIRNIEKGGVASAASRRGLIAALAEVESTAQPATASKAAADDSTSAADETD